MLPLSRGESFLENRVFSNPDEVEWESLDLADAARLRQALRPRRLRPAEPGGDRLRRPLPVRHRPGHRRRRRGGRRAGAPRVRGAEAARAAPSTTTSSTAPASTCWRSCATLFPDEVRAEVEGQAGRLWERPAGQRGADRPRPRAEGDAARACRSPAWRPQPGPRLRQSRRPRPALKPRAAAVACWKKSPLIGESSLLDMSVVIE